MPRFPIALGALAVCVLASCSADSRVSTGPLALYRGEPNGDDALVEGLLTLEDGCLYVTSRNPTGPRKALLVFSEKGTSWDESKQAVVRKGGRSLVVGTNVAVGGSEAANLDVFEWAVRAAVSCDTSIGWVAGED